MFIAETLVEACRKIVSYCQRKNLLLLKCAHIAAIFGMKENFKRNLYPSIWLTILEQKN